MVQLSVQGVIRIGFDIHSIISNILKYRVLKKSLCTWRLQYNFQVNRDFLITLCIWLLYKQQKTLFVNNQLDAQFFFLIRSFQFSTCFEQPCAHHQESKFYQYDIWYMSLSIGDRLRCRLAVCIPDGHLHRVTYNRCRIDTIDSLDDENIAARNM